MFNSIFISLIAIYILSLIICTFYAYKDAKMGREGFILGGKKGIGVTLGFLTYSATLFSTFTLMGMPDFFRVNGVGAWIFLGITDVAMGMIILLFGVKLKQYLKNKKFESVGIILQNEYKNRAAYLVYLLGIFIFCAPYVAIQIKGLGDFLSVSSPLNIPMWVWSVGVILIMLVTSWIGGLKSVMYADVVQGILLLLVVWIIAQNCLDSVLSTSVMFETLQKVNPQLLSVPGPKGLFSTQFLLASFITIILMPITQPQLTIRIALMQNLKKLKIMAVAVSIFAFLVIAPTIIIGLSGAIVFPFETAPEFISKTLINKAFPILSGLAIVGLLAAAMSTLDSLFFALGTEAEDLVNKNKRKKGTLAIKILIALFSGLALLMAMYSSQSLVMLARVSFAGTAILAPMVLTAILYKGKKPTSIIWATLIGLIVFMLTSMNIIPSTALGIRADIGVLMLVSLYSLIILAVDFYKLKMQKI